MLQLDQQEATLKEQERQKALEIANQKLWNQTANVRELHARMFLSEVLAERIGQIQLKKKIEEIDEAEKAEFHNAMLARFAVRIFSEIHKNMDV